MWKSKGMYCQGDLGEKQKSGDLKSPDIKTYFIIQKSAVLRLHKQTNVTEQSPKTDPYRCLVYNKGDTAIPQGMMIFLINYVESTWKKNPDNLCHIVHKLNSTKVAYNPRNIAYPKQKA